MLLRYADPAWLVRLVLGLGGGARLLEPPELAEAVGERAREALAAGGRRGRETMGDDADGDAHGWSSVAGCCSLVLVLLALPPGAAVHAGARRAARRVVAAHRDRCGAGAVDVAAPTIVDGHRGPG